MSRVRHFPRLHRQVGTRATKTKIVIYTEGKNTERYYFAEMKRFFRSVVVDIEIIEGAGVPLSIAKKAAVNAKSAQVRSRRQSYARCDEYWAVFDRDDHPNILEAISRCNDANVRVAFSDPCFELWIILHFQDYDRPDNRHDIQRRLETLCGD